MPVASTEVLPPLLVTAIATRAYVLAVGLCATLLLGFPEELEWPLPSSSANPVLDLPFRWDTEWYVSLARDGYRWDGEPGVLENIAFFPAYPLALRAVAWATGAADSIVRWNWTGVVFSTLLLVTALWYLSRLGALLADASTGYRAALLCAVYPWSIYFGLPYTESLFLLACCAATYRYLCGRHVEAFAWGLVAGLTRPNGVVLALLLGMLWMRDVYRLFGPQLALSLTFFSRAHSPFVGRGASAERIRMEGTTLVVPERNTTFLVPERNAAMSESHPWSLLRSALPICAPILGVMMYSAYVHGVTGDPLTWLRVQEAWGRHSMDPVFVLSRFAADLIASPIALAREHPYKFANGVTGLLALALVIPVGRRLGWAYAAFVLLGVLMPVAGGGLASLGRYTAILFPIFLYLAHLSQRPVFISLVALSLVAQGLVSALFFTWRPVY
jgi:hypothetical protein